MPDIHPTAIVEAGAVMAEDVVVGPFCLVGKNVQLRSGVILDSHVVVSGTTTIGERTRIFPFAAIGTAPQHVKYAGEETILEIGSDCVIREHATANTGTVDGGGITRIGNRCMMMVASHVAHDCQVGNGVMLVNNATLGGHCTVGDYAILGGLSAVHQFVRIGEYSFIGGLSAVVNDLIPFGMALGDRAHLAGLNIVGMKRRAMPRQQIYALRKAYRQLFSDTGTLKDRVETVAGSFPDNTDVQRIVEFLREGGERALTVPAPRRRN